MSALTKFAYMGIYKYTKLWLVWCVRVCVCEFIAKFNNEIHLSNYEKFSLFIKFIEQIFHYLNTHHDDGLKRT